MEKKSRRKHSAENKQEAVALANQPGQSIAAVVTNLGIGPGLLQRWKRELSDHGVKAFVGQGVARDQKLLELRRKLAQVKKERDFLISAAVYFAKEGK